MLSTITSLYNYYFKTQEQSDKQQLDESSYGTYLTHDNGGRLYKVEITSEQPNVKIYKNKYDSDENNWTNDPILTYNPIKVFIGKSPMNRTTIFSGGHGPKFDGNSILLQTENNKYVFIGRQVIEFESLAPIINFVSPVGNSDVPYPYAIDEKNNCYLLIEDVILTGKADVSEKHLQELINEPYDYYYYIKLITSDEGIIPPKHPHIKNFQNIKSWFVGIDKYTMKYHPFPEKDYDRIMDWNEGEMSIIYTDGETKKISKEDYVNIMRDYEKEAKVQPLHSIKID